VNITTPQSSFVAQVAVRKELKREPQMQEYQLHTNRRQFLGAAGGALTTAWVAGDILAGRSAEAATVADRLVQAASHAKKKIPIGVFDPVYKDLTLDEMLDKVSALGLEAMEIGTGGYPGSHHCPVDELVRDPTKARAWKRKFEDHNLQVATLSCHGNPVHPDRAHAARDIESFRQTVLLAERLEVIPVIVGFAGCPGGSPNDTQPNWITYRWPPEYKAMLDWQWKEKVIPYWKDAAKFAREHGIKRLAFEMHPNFVVYNPKTLLQLREAVGEEIGANCDLSHLFWQGCDPIEVIHLLGKNGALFHAHMKDTVLYPENLGRYGVLNFVFEKEDLPNASDAFRAVGYGHSASQWKAIVQAYMDVNYEGILSIENEDPILSGEVGVERAAYVLKNVRAELLG
jgi:sugar phosphate isomerase/epimerase